MRGPAVVVALLLATTASWAQRPGETGNDRSAAGDRQPASGSQTERFAKAIERLATDAGGAAEELIRIAEEAPGDPLAAEGLFAAARAFEEKLENPGMAARLYRRVVTEHPASRVALAASRRLEELGRLVDGAPANDARAATLFRLKDEANPRAAAAMADRLAQEEWPGAAAAALWAADTRLRLGDAPEALRGYQLIATRWPGSDEARRALRSSSAAAAAAGDWAAAERFARALPDDDESARIVREELIAAAQHGRRLARRYVVAGVLLAVGVVGLVLSLVLAGGRRSWTYLAPSTEVLFMVPVAVLLVAGSMTTHVEIAPAVGAICVGGLVITWLSGAGLAAARAKGRGELRLRIVVHAVLAAAAAVGLVYVALVRGDLVDLVIETMRHGPE